MEFLQPALLWGFLAVTIPVVIHFWYQKKGKTIAWAASQWLTDKTSLQHRGLRLDEIPLLLIRCLLVILFILLLSKPVFNWLKAGQVTEKIHLVEPDEQLVSNFRFELETAVKSGEKVYWISPGKEEVKNISMVPKQKYSALYLQKTINQYGKAGKELNLYISNRQNLAELPPIYVPGSFKLFSIINSSRNVPVRYFDLGKGKKLFVNQKTGEAAQLKVAGAANGDPADHFISEPAHKGKIQVLIDYKNPAEQQTVQAALLALSEVYAIPFSISLKKNPAIKYDWVFTDQEIKDIIPAALYVISGKISNKYSTENVIQIRDSLRLPTSELVQTGQLPEYLGNILVAHYKLKENINPLSQQQLKARFIPVKSVANETADTLYQWLLLFFVITLLLERWIALRKTVSQTYA